MHYAGAAQGLREDNGWVLPRPEQSALDADLSPVVSRLAPAPRVHAQKGGRLTPLADVVAEALEDTATDSPA